MKRKMQRHGVEGGLFGVQFKRMVLIVGALVGVFARGKTTSEMILRKPPAEIFPTRVPYPWHVMYPNLKGVSSLYSESETFPPSLQVRLLSSRV